MKECFEKISETIEETLYSDLYTTSDKKLSFLHANLVIEGIFNEEIEVNECFNAAVINILKMDFNDNYDKTALGLSQKD